MAESPMAVVTPTDATLTLDGVETRIWAAATVDGNVPFALAVHRVFIEAEHEAAVVLEFPTLLLRVRPGKVEGNPTWGGPCLRRVREALATAQNDLCRHYAHADEPSEHITAALAAVEIACDEIGGLPPHGIQEGDDTGFVTAEDLKPWPCPCRDCSAADLRGHIGTTNEASR